MDEKSENGGRYRLGRHWQTIQRSLFPEWEREMDMKFIEEEKRRRADVGDGLPAAKAPDGRRLPHGGDQGLGVWIVAHRLEDVRLEQADAAARRTPVPAPSVLGEHLVVDEQFALAP